MISSYKYARNAAWVSIIVNLFLFVIKYAAGIASNSLALIADAWHTLSDTFSSIIVLISAKISQIPADRKHPFGHGRADLIASIIMGVILVIVGFNFFGEGFQRLMDHETIRYKQSAIIVTVISILCKEALAQYSFWAGKRSGYQTLRADAWHHRSDSISSVIVLIGIFVNKYFWWIDSVLSIAISLLLFHASWSILKNAVNPLIGESPSNKLINRVKEICYKQTGQDVEPHHFHMHRYGKHTELTFHIRLQGVLKLEEAHSVAEKIEIAIRDELDIEATIHLDPQ